MRERLANLGAIGLVACAIVLSAMNLISAKRVSRVASVGTIASVPVKEWRRYAATGHRLGANTSPVVISEFSDFACSFCAKAQSTLRAILVKYKGQVAISFHHWPQTALHPHALDAAIASECAADQGAFEQYHDLLFAQQDSIGVRSWVAIAIDARVRDTIGFGRCVASRQHVTEIASDAAAAEKLGGRGTPFFLVNDRAISGAAPMENFDAIIKEKLAARR